MFNKDVICIFVNAMTPGPWPHKLMYVGECILILNGEFYSLLYVLYYLLPTILIMPLKFGMALICLMFYLKQFQLNDVIDQLLIF